MCRALDWLPMSGGGQISDHSDAASVCIADSPLCVGDNVSRAFISETVSRVLVGDATLEGTLHRLAVLANDTMLGSDMVAVTTLVTGRPRTAGFTDGLASEIDDIQCRSRVGPCLDAVRRQRVVRVDSIEKDQRWPAFIRAATARGISSILSFPLVVHHQGIGALNCYSKTLAAFSADDERTGSAFAAAAAIALAYWDARHPDDRLGLAPQSPATIEQAKAILMAVRGGRTTIPSKTGLGPPRARTKGFVAEIFQGHDN
jgi:hypothetical protein